MNEFPNFFLMKSSYIKYILLKNKILFNVIQLINKFDKSLVELFIYFYFKKKFQLSLNFLFINLLYLFFSLLLKY